MNYYISMAKNFSSLHLTFWFLVVVFFSLGSSKCWFKKDDAASVVPATPAPSAASVSIYNEAGDEELTTHDFSVVELGSSSDLTLTLKNDGESTAKVIELAFDAAVATASFQFKGGTFPGTGGTCETTLEASKSCTLVLSFVPHSSVATAYSTSAISDTLNLTYLADAEKSAEIALTGSVSYCVSATELFSQTGIDSGSAASMTTDSHRTAQSFFWNTAKKIKSVALSQYISAGTTFATIDLKIYADCSGAPCTSQGAIAASHQAIPAILSGSRAWYTYTLALPASIEANTTYWFVVSANSLNGLLFTDKYNSNGYGGGLFAYSSNEGASYSSASGDLAFKVDACN